MRTTKLFLVTLIAVLLGVGRAIAQDNADAYCPDSQFTSWGAVGVVTPGDANNLRDEPSTTGTT